MHKEGSARSFVVTRAEGPGRSGLLSENMGAPGAGDGPGNNNGGIPLSRKGTASSIASDRGGLQQRQRRASLGHIPLVHAGRDRADPGNKGTPSSLASPPRRARSGSGAGSDAGSVVTGGDPHADRPSRVSRASGTSWTDTSLTHGRIDSGSVGSFETDGTGGRRFGSMGDFRAVTGTGDGSGSLSFLGGSFFQQVGRPVSVGPGAGSGSGSGDSAGGPAGVGGGGPGEAPGPGTGTGTGTGKGRSAVRGGPVASRVMNEGAGTSPKQQQRQQQADNGGVAIGASQSGRRRRGAGARRVEGADWELVGEGAPAVRRSVPLGHVRSEVCVVS